MSDMTHETNMSNFIRSTFKSVVRPTQQYSADYRPN